MRRWIHDKGIEFIKFARKLTLSCRYGTCDCDTILLPKASPSPYIVLGLDLSARVKKKLHNGFVMARTCPDNERSVTILP
jgi:hypothetical protein